MMTETDRLPCPHGRPSWHSCPHCLGINRLPQPPRERRYSFTRDRLIDALTHLETRVLVSGPAAGMINAESMADAIIGALENGESAATKGDGEA